PQLRKARRVNSPALVAREQCRRKSIITCSMIYLDLWLEISTISSFVYECGATNRETNTSSIICSPSRMVPKCMVWEACCVSSFPLKTALTIAMACGPDKRITAIAPFAPGEVAKATMVSCTDDTDVDMLQK